MTMRHVKICLAALLALAFAFVPVTATAQTGMRGASWARSQYAMPFGADGYWVAKDYLSTPRKVIPNRAAPADVSLDQSLLGAPRRVYTATGSPWTSSLGGNTLTDNSATTPDGTANEAATVVATGSADWQIRTNPNTFQRNAVRHLRKP